MIKKLDASSSSAGQLVLPPQGKNFPPLTPAKMLRSVDIRIGVHVLYQELARIAVTMYCIQLKRTTVKVFLLELTVIGVREVLCRAGLVSLTVV